MATQKKDNAASERPADSVASPAENDRLEHTRGGSTTRDDRLDAGVPMKQGEEGTTEPVGPEDALGPDATRGDYSGRIDSGPHMVAVPTSADERQGEELKDDDGNVIGREPGPHSKLVEQTAADQA
jgi:hypothetical protein